MDLTLFIAMDSVQSMTTIESLYLSISLSEEMEDNLMTGKQPIVRQSTPRPQSLRSDAID